MSFFVTTIAYYPEHEDKKYHEPFRHTCTFGHFGHLERARTAVNDNEGGMDECLYNYLVIEELPYGIHPCVSKNESHEWWHQWEHPEGQEGHWVSIDKPEWSKMYLAWALA